MNRLRHRFLAVAAALAVLGGGVSLVAAAPGDGAKPAASAATSWARANRYVIKMFGSRVGESVIAEQTDTFEGKPATKIDSTSTIKVQVFQNLEQKIRTLYYLDAKMVPLWMSMHMTSGGTSTHVEARFHADRVEASIKSGGPDVTTKTIPVPSGISLQMDPYGGVATRPAMKIGDRQSVHVFEPLTLTLMKIESEVVRRDTVKLPGGEVEAFVIKSKNPLTGDSTSTVTPAGELLREQAANGVMLERVDLAEAGSVPSTQSGQAATPQPGETPAFDLATRTAVDAGVNLTSPRSVRTLAVTVKNIPDREMVLADHRQRAEVAGEEGGALTVKYAIAADDPATKGPVLKEFTTRGKYAEPVPYCEASHPEIQRTARTIVAGKKDRLEAARAIRAWVYSRMKPEFTMGVPRSALNVLRKPQGVCRDYATLFTALARAAGVPTRVAAGMVYWQGRFYYHAWVECQVARGENGWLALDPTLPMDFVDATHIKLAQGDPAEMFGAARAIGRLQATITDYAPKSAGPAAGDVATLTPPQ